MLRKCVSPRSEGGGEGLALTLVEDRSLCHLFKTYLVEIQKEYLQTLLGFCQNVNLFRAGHIAKAYGVMREGSGYR